jgi:hypothetical protein
MGRSVLRRTISLRKKEKYVVVLGGVRGADLLFQYIGQRDRITKKDDL